MESAGCRYCEVWNVRTYLVCTGVWVRTVEEERTKKRDKETENGAKEGGRRKVRERKRKKTGRGCEGEM
jgi:hypothetical protein